MTDIEMPKPADSTTPTKHQFATVTLTPPTTVKAKRTVNKQKDVTDDVAQFHDELATATTQMKRKGGPFASFQRKKSTNVVTHSRKREGSPMAQDNASKRTRSGVHS